MVWSNIINNDTAMTQKRMTCNINHQGKDKMLFKNTPSLLTWNYFFLFLGVWFSLGPPMLKMFFNEIFLLIPTGIFCHRFSANPGSSEVRVSDRAAPLQLTWIQGLARERFSIADACQHGHRAWVIQWKYSLSDLEVRGFQSKDTQVVLVDGI